MQLLVYILVLEYFSRLLSNLQLYTLQDLVSYIHQLEHRLGIVPESDRKRLESSGVSKLKAS